MVHLRRTQSEHWLEIIPCPKWVRVVLGGAVIADSKAVMLLRESGHTPVYYFPSEDVGTGLLTLSDQTTHDAHKGEATYWSVAACAKVAENAAWSYPEPPVEAAGLKGLIAFEWGKMDAWFEENEEVFVHPRDPYKRIDVIQSSRHVQVVVGGETVAETHNPVMLFETGLPTRYYIPKMDVRQDLLKPSERLTYCPYKGEAAYYSIAVDGQVSTDLIWYYAYPTAESARIAGLLCFFNERVDALYVDGELMPKPKTRWSEL